MALFGNLFGGKKTINSDDTSFGLTQNSGTPYYSLFGGESIEAIVKASRRVQLKFVNPNNEEVDNSTTERALEPNDIRSLLEYYCESANTYGAFLYKWVKVGSELYIFPLNLKDHSVALDNEVVKAIFATQNSSKTPIYIQADDEDKNIGYGISITRDRQKYQFIKTYKGNNYADPEEAISFLHYTQVPELASYVKLEKEMLNTALSSFKNQSVISLLLSLKEGTNPDAIQMAKETLRKAYQGSDKSFGTVLMENVTATKFEKSSFANEFVSTYNLLQTSFQKYFNIPNSLSGVENNTPTSAQLQQHSIRLFYNQTLSYFIDNFVKTINILLENQQLADRLAFSIDIDSKEEKIELARNLYKDGLYTRGQALEYAGLMDSELSPEDDVYYTETRTNQAFDITNRNIETSKKKILAIDQKKLAVAKKVFKVETKNIQQVNERGELESFITMSDAQIERHSNELYELFLNSVKAFEKDIVPSIKSRTDTIVGVIRENVIQVGTDTSKGIKTKQVQLDSQVAIQIPELFKEFNDYLKSPELTEKLNDIIDETGNELDRLNVAVYGVYSSAVSNEVKKRVFDLIANNTNGFLTEYSLTTQKQVRSIIEGISEFTTQQDVFEKLKDTLSYSDARLNTMARTSVNNSIAEMELDSILNNPLIDNKTWNNLFDARDWHDPRTSNFSSPKTIPKNNYWNVSDNKGRQYRYFRQAEGISSINCRCYVSPTISLN